MPQSVSLVVSSQRIRCVCTNKLGLLAHLSLSPRYPLIVRDNGSLPTLEVVPLLLSSRATGAGTSVLVVLVDTRRSPLQLSHGATPGTEGDGDRDGFKKEVLLQSALGTQQVVKALSNLPRAGIQHSWYWFCRGMVGLSVRHVCLGTFLWLSE